MIVGGAMRDSTIFKRFMELAGGMDAPVVVIVAAMADTVTNEMIVRQKQYFENLGANNLTSSSYQGPC